jgi:hypothetical protein
MTSRFAEKADTVLAFSNGESFTVMIPKQVKQICLRELRSRQIAATDIYLRMFAVGLYFLLQSHLHKLDLVVVDREYPGQEQKIKQQLYNLLRRRGQKPRHSQLVFGYLYLAILAKNPMHNFSAWVSHRGTQKADLILTVEDVLREF